MIRNPNPYSPIRQSHNNSRVVEEELFKFNKSIEEMKFEYDRFVTNMKQDISSL